MHRIFTGGLLAPKQEGHDALVLDQAIVAVSRALGFCLLHVGACACCHLIGTCPAGNMLVVLAHFQACNEGAAATGSLAPLPKS